MSSILLQTPPDPVVRAAQANWSEHAEPDPINEVLLSLKSDLNGTGRFGQTWLIVTPIRLSVIALDEEGKSRQIHSLATPDIADAQIIALVGCGTLRVTLNSGLTVDVIRFTQSVTHQFSAASRIIKAAAKGEEKPHISSSSLESKICPKCDMPLPDDTRVCPACVDRRSTMLRLLGYGKRYSGRATLMVLLSFGGTALSLVPPYLTKVLMDQVLVPHRHVERIPIIVGFWIAVSLIGVAVGIWRGRTAAWLTCHMVFTMRDEVYRKMHALSISYYDKRQVGSLMARITQDVNELRNFMVDGVQYFFVNSLTILGILAVMLRFNPFLTLLALIPVPITVFLTWKLMRKFFGKLRKFWHLRSNLSATINAALSGIRVVKAFAQEEREKQRFTGKSHRLFDSELGVELTSATYFPLLGAVATAGTFLIYLVGGREVVANISNKDAHGMTLGTLMMFLSYLGMLMGPIQGMTQIANWLSRSAAAGERVFEVLDADIDVPEPHEPVAMPLIDGRVEMTNVRFSYDRSQPAIEELTINVEPGEMIGLVGHSGAGKSTFIKLLLRFYDATDGEILIDGVDIRKIHIDDLRRQIGVVLQEPFLFPGSIHDNIAYANPSATMDEIIRSAKAANAHNFIMRLPDGYDTLVGEHGYRLSGGERQRISIARAILHNPRVLILDEATASVDTETEQQIQEAIQHLVKGRTTFAIAHRLSTLRDADRLLVLEKGRVVELGTHEELLAKPDGVYHRLVDMQQQVNKLRDESVLVS